MRLIKDFKYISIIFLVLMGVLARAEDLPKRIVSLSPSITEGLYYLGLQEHLIGVTSYCNHPEGVKEKEIIGTMTNPNIEKVYSLCPDLVLAVDGINRPQTIERLRSLGIKVIVFDQNNSLDGIMKDFIQLGRLTGREKKAREIVKEVRKEVKSIAQKVESLPSIRIFWEVGSMPLVSIGNKSFANEFIRYSGGINIFSEVSFSYIRVSREEVLRNNPEVIMLVTMGDVTEKEKVYWQRFKEIDAAKFNRIYIIDADKVCRPTPVSFLIGLKEVARILHPEIFDEQ